jgi:indoleamine 2,3-dioxygenase
MVLKELLPSFNVLSDTKPDDVSLPAFMVSTSRGFLPRDNPIVQLPPDFDTLESILRRMPVKTADGSPGLLAMGTFGETVDKELPDLIAAINKHASNLPLMNALYRDYSFLASAYLLEPCKHIDVDIFHHILTTEGHQRFIKGQSYGLARHVLPRNIALPICRVAEMYVDPILRVILLVNADFCHTVLASSRSWSMLDRMRSSTTDSRTPRVIWTMIIFA